MRASSARNSLERMTDAETPHHEGTGSIEIPPESALLKAAAKRAGFTVA